MPETVRRLTMTGTIISKKTRKEFREYFVNKAIREIGDAFDGAGVRGFDPQLSGQRRTLVEQYDHSVNWQDWRSTGRVVKVYESKLLSLYAPPEIRYPCASGETQTDRQRCDHIAQKLLYWLRQDGFE